MRSMKPGSLGLLTTVVVLLALTATAANAETNAKWVIVTEKGEIDANNLHASTGVNLDKSDGTFLTMVLKAKVSILCTSVEVSAGGALLGEGSISEGKLKFSGCETLLNGVKNSACVPRSSGAAAGTIETKSLLGLLTLHVLQPSEVHDTLLRIFPSVGTLLATLEMSETCAIGEKITINGMVFLQDCCSFQMHLVNHLVSEGPLTELWVLNRTVEHLESKLDGSGNIFLTGTHLGLLWFGEAG